MKYGIISSFGSEDMTQGVTLRRIWETINEKLLHITLPCT